MEWYHFVIMVITCLAVFVAAVFVWRKGWVSTDGLSYLSASIDRVYNDLISDGESLFDRIVGYAATAVHAAEQMCRVGLIKQEERKTTAMQLVQDYASVDGITLNEAAVKVADSVIESECNLMGHADDIEDGIYIDALTDEQLADLLIQMNVPHEKVKACETRAELLLLLDNAPTENE